MTHTLMGMGAAASPEAAGNEYQLHRRAQNRTAITSQCQEDAPGNLIRQIRGLGSLESGWDSHGSPAINEENIQGAISVVLGLYAAASALSIQFPKPSVFPSSDGVVGLYWRNDVRKADLEVLMSGNEIDLVASSDGYVVDQSLPTANVLEILAWVHRQIVTA